MFRTKEMGLNRRRHNLQRHAHIGVPVSSVPVASEPGPSEYYISIRAESCSRGSTVFPLYNSSTVFRNVRDEFPRTGGNHGFPTGKKVK